MSKRVVLQITVPRLNEVGPQAMEQIFAALHGLLSKALSNAQEETLSFEIARARGRIFFYATCPAHLKTLIKSQIYAQYSRVHIDEVPDYLTDNILKDKQVLCADLDLGNIEVFPIKRHPQFMDASSRQFVDPLATITSSLQSLYAKDNIASIQLTVRPIDPDWNEIAELCARKYLSGGKWSKGWLRKWYHWARADYDKWTRGKRFWAWGLLQFFFRTGSVRDLGGGVSVTEDNDGEFDRQSATNSRHDRETAFGSIYDSLARLQYHTQMRVLYVHTDPDKLHAEAKMRGLLGTLKQFSLAHSNGFVLGTFTRSKDSEVFQNFRNRVLGEQGGYALSGEELATVWHLPTLAVTSPSIQWINSAALEPPVDLPDPETEEFVTGIGRTNFRGANQLFGLRVKDRRRHVYVIGKTGMGKSTILLNMLHDDILKGHGVGLVDPHGDLVEDILRRIPPSRTNDVVYLNPADVNYPVAFNMLEMPPGQTMSNVAGGIVSVFKKLYANSWGPRLEHILRNTLLTLLDVGGQSLLGVLRILSDDKYRAQITRQIKDPMLAQFWEGEFKKLGKSEAKLAEAVAPIQNKVGQFLAAPMVRHIIGQTKSTIKIRDAMDSGKIVLVNLSKGLIGEDNAAMLGSMIVTKFQIDAMSRSNIPQDQRRDFSLYVDEFQNFATESFATILSEARKYRLWLTMANQYVDQMPEEVSAAVFGNVGSIVSYQVGYSDAEFLSKQLNEELVTPEDLTNLPKYQYYTRLLVDGMPTPVFSATALPPSQECENADVRAQKIINSARHRYAKSVDVVRENITKWMMPPKPRDDKDTGKNDKKGPKGDAAAKPDKKPAAPKPATKSEKKPAPKPAAAKPATPVQNAPKAKPAPKPKK